MNEIPETRNQKNQLTTGELQTTLNFFSDAILDVLA